MRAIVFASGLFVGACATAAMQSAASIPAGEPVPTEPASAPDGPRWVTPLAEAPRRVSPPGTGTITILAQGENAFLGKLEMEPGAAVPMHRDATEEYIHVLEGGGEITIDGQRFTVEAGSTIYMPADAEVEYINGEAPLVAIQVFAGPEPASKYDAWASAK